MNSCVSLLSAVIDVALADQQIDGVAAGGNDDPPQRRADPGGNRRPRSRCRKSRQIILFAVSRNSLLTVNLKKFAVLLTLVRETLCLSVLTRQKQYFQLSVQFV